MADVRGRFDWIIAFVRRHWPTLFLVIGTIVFVLGASGYVGYQAPSSRESSLLEPFGEYSPGNAAHFPREARAEMAAGAGLVVMGMVGLRGKR